MNYPDDRELLIKSTEDIQRSQILTPPEKPSRTDKRIIVRFPHVMTSREYMQQFEEKQKTRQIEEDQKKLRRKMSAAKKAIKKEAVEKKKKTDFDDSQVNQHKSHRAVA